MTWLAGLTTCSGGHAASATSGRQAGGTDALHTSAHLEQAAEAVPRRLAAGGGLLHLHDVLLGCLQEGPRVLVQPLAEGSAV